MTSGGLMTRWAQESHLLMCTSVPQMEVFLILMSTSLTPGRGTGTLVMMRPGPAVGFTMARMVEDMERDWLVDNLGGVVRETTPKAYAVQGICLKIRRSAEFS